MCYVGSYLSLVKPLPLLVSQWFRIIPEDLWNQDKECNVYAQRWNDLEGSRITKLKILSCPFQNQSKRNRPIKSRKILISPLNHQSKRNCPEEETGKGRRQPAGKRSCGRCLMSWSHYCCFSVGTLMITLTR